MADSSLGLDWQVFAGQSTVVMATETHCFALVPCSRPPLTALLLGGCCARPAVVSPLPSFYFILFLFYFFFPCLDRVHLPTCRSAYLCRLKSPLGPTHPHGPWPSPRIAGRNCSRANISEKCWAMRATTLSAVGPTGAPPAGGRQALPCDAPGPCLNHSRLPP